TSPWWMNDIAPYLLEKHLHQENWMRRHICSGKRTKKRTVFPWMPSRKCCADTSRLSTLMTWPVYMSEDFQVTNSPKIKPSALQKIEGKAPDDLVEFSLRLSQPMLTEEDMGALEIIGCTNFYQSVYVASATVSVNRVEALASLDSIKEIR